MWDFLDSVQSSDVVKSVDAWGQPSVQAEYLVVDKCSQGQVIEEIREIFPDIRIAVLSETLVVESVYLGNLT